MSGLQRVSNRIGATSFTFSGEPGQTYHIRRDSDGALLSSVTFAAKYEPPPIVFRDGDVIRWGGDMSALRTGGAWVSSYGNNWPDDEMRESLARGGCWLVDLSKPKDAA